MSASRVIPVGKLGGKPSPEVLAQLDKHWRWHYLLLAPHRVGFFLAMLVLVVQHNGTKIESLVMSPRMAELHKLMPFKAPPDEQVRAVAHARSAGRCGRATRPESASR